MALSVTSPVAKPCGDTEPEKTAAARSKKTLPFHVAKIISERYPLRGQEAADAIRVHLASMGNLAAEEGLSEADVIRMLNEN